MAVFYNNLFRTASPRTILQATVNNIQHGTENSDTMVALHQIYRKLAKKMKLKLPLLLNGFLNSKAKDYYDQQKDIFFDEVIDNVTTQTDSSINGKYLSAEAPACEYSINLIKSPLLLSSCVELEVFPKSTFLMRILLGQHKCTYLLCPVFRIWI